MIIFMVLLVVMTNALHATNKPAAHDEQSVSRDTASSSAIQNSGKSITELEDIIKQLRRDIIEIRTNIKDVQADVSQEKLEQQQLIKKIATLSEKVDTFSLQLNHIMHEEKAQKEHVDASYAADCQRFQVEIQKAQELLQEIKKQYEIQTRQFDQQRRSLETVERNVRDEINFYAEASEKKLQLFSEEIRDGLQKERSEIIRKMQKSKIALDMNVQQYKKDLEKIAEEKIRGIKELQGDNTHIKRLDEIIKYCMMSQSLLVSIPVTYGFYVFVSKLCALFSKKEAANQGRITTLQFFKKMLKSILVATGVTTTYITTSFLLYRTSRYLMLQEPLLPYQDDFSELLPLL